MKSKINLLKSKNGSALVYVLLLLFVLSILGTAFLSMSFYTNNLANTNYKNTQAHYYAHSAVETTISYLSANMTSQNILPDIGQSILSDEMNSQNIMSNYKVKIERIDQYTAKITATSKYKNQTSTVSANISVTLPNQKTANLENYTAYLKGSGNKITDPIILDQLKTANFQVQNDKLTYVRSDNIKIQNLTTTDFNNIPDGITKPDPGWNTAANTTIDLTSGGIYKYNGDINLNRDVTFTIGNEDVFLFLNGNFTISKYWDLQRTTGSTGTFFLIFTGTNRTFSCDNGAGALNNGTTANNMANLLIYGPDVKISRKNKFYYKGAVIAYSYLGNGSQASFNTAYLKASATINGVPLTNVSPWAVLFDKLDNFNIKIVTPTGGSVNSVTWDNNVNEIALS
jgi:hypothetical protein